ncbi:hypothetical protein IWZ01DRAFT_484099 [Phyllosticta capitalensis]
MIDLLLLLLVSYAFAESASVPTASMLPSSFYLSLRSRNTSGLLWQHHDYGVDWDYACDDDCDANCVDHFDQSDMHGQLRMDCRIRQTIAYVIVNHQANTTRTSTSYLELPHYTPPPTNAAGTRLAVHAVAEAVDGVWSTFERTITYPTVYTQYHPGYTYWGAIPTTAADGQSVCSWAPYDDDTPQTDSSYFADVEVGDGVGGTTTEVSPTKARGAFVSFTSVNPFGPEGTANASDPGGVFYSLSHNWKKIYGAPPGITESAMRQCSFTQAPGWRPEASEGAAPEVYYTASYLIATSTIHEDTTSSAAAASTLVGGIVGAITASGPATSSQSASAAAAKVAGSSTQSVGQGSQSTAAAAAATAATASSPPPPSSSAQTVFQGVTVSQNSQSQIVVNSQTVTGSAVTIGSGASTTVVQVQTSNGATQLIAGGTTTTLPPASSAGGISPGTAITVGGQTFSANSASQLVVGSQTLASGSSITIGTGASTTVVALQTGTNGQAQLVVGNQTTDLAASTTSHFATIAAGATISRNAQSEIIINGQTLKPGVTVTIGNGTAQTTIGMQTSRGNTALIVDGKSTTLGQNATTAKSSASSDGLGGAIITGLGGAVSPTTAGAAKGTQSSAAAPGSGSSS